MKITLSKRLLEIRSEKSLKQADVAKYIKVDPSTYAKWERGDYEPNLQTLADLAELFGVTAGYLLGIED